MMNRLKECIKLDLKYFGLQWKFATISFVVKKEKNNNILDCWFFLFPK